jgi:hypothetical protein
LSSARLFALRSASVNVSLRFGPGRDPWDHGLTRTGRWKDPDSADRYNHTMASPEARRADLMPGAKIRGESGELPRSKQKRE